MSDPPTNMSDLKRLEVSKLGKDSDLHPGIRIDMFQSEAEMLMRVLYVTRHVPLTVGMKKARDRLFEALRENHVRYKQMG